MRLDPKLLPDISSIRRRAKSLAMLDAILCPEWEYRHFSFDAKWGEDEMASFRNGEGDDWFLQFDTVGAAIKGLAHETPMAGNKNFITDVSKQVPRIFSSFLDQPAYGWSWLSYCYWRTNEDAAWKKVVPSDVEFSQADDGSEEFLGFLVEPESSYIEISEWYFETEIPLKTVQDVYNHKPLNENLVRSLNSTITFEQVKMSALEISYPF